MAVTFRTRSSISFPPTLCFCKSLTQAISLLAQSQSRWLCTTHVHTPSVIRVNRVASGSQQRGTGAASSTPGTGKLKINTSCFGAGCAPSPCLWLCCSHCLGKADRAGWYTVKHGVAGTILNILYIQILRSLSMTWCQFYLRLIDKVPSVFAVLPKQSITVGNNYRITNSKLKLFC